MPPLTNIPNLRRKETKKAERISELQQVDRKLKADATEHEEAEQPD